jgi:hypothetical protein
MKPLFTVHAGEYLVGSEVERRFPRVNVWIPTKDSGIDLLVSNRTNRRAVSLQVKFSKDYLYLMEFVLQKRLRACGWWTIKPEKLRKSRADFWVLVLQGFAEHTTDFVIVPPGELLRRLKSIHRSEKQKVFQTYLWVTEEGRCWETRGLPRKDQLRIADGIYQEPCREFTRWLNNWDPVVQLER